MDATHSPVHPSTIPSLYPSAFRPWDPTSQPNSSPTASHSPPQSRPTSTSQRRRRPCVLNRSTVGIQSTYRACNPSFQYHQAIRRCLTKPSDPVHNNNWDNVQHDYILRVNDTLQDDRGNTFSILDLLGTGTFGQVVECKCEQTGENVAVKVIKNQPAYFNQAWVEINILKMLHFHNSPGHTTHIVRLNSHFIFRGHLCLVFERLSMNLYELLKLNSYKGVGLDLLRKFLIQILDALIVLVRSEVIHCDLKPENILLKSVGSAQLKLIDFGSACQLNYPIYSYVQSRFYRSPEVLLGSAKYNSQIDMWSLGCVAAELFLGIPLFPGQNEMNMVCRIVEMLGGMPDRFLHQCRNTDKFFNRTRMHMHPGVSFQLKPIAQYERENNVTLPPWKRFFNRKSLRDIILTYPKSTNPQHSFSSTTTSSSSSVRSSSPPHPPFSHTQLNPAVSATNTTSSTPSTPRSSSRDQSEVRMRECFVDLLQGMLRVDPSERWTPSEASQHPFLRGELLPAGQPWAPPSRPRRIARTITTATAQDTLYSSSAPNFKRNPPPTPGFQIRQFAPFPHPQSAQPPPAHIPIPTGTTASEQMSAGLHPPAFAPGSYIPPSAMASSFTPSGPLTSSINSIPNAIPHTNSSNTNPGSNPNANFKIPPLSAITHSLAPGSYDGRVAYLPFEYNVPHLNQPNTPTEYASSFGNSVSVATNVPNVSGGPVRVGTGVGLHGSASRESLTGSLHPSASRESLGAMDYSEDACLFPLVPDDDQSLSSNPLSGSTSIRKSDNLPSSSLMPSVSSSAVPPSAGYTSSQPPFPLSISIAQQSQKIQQSQPPLSLPLPPVNSVSIPSSAELPPTQPWIPSTTATGYPGLSGSGVFSGPGSWSGSWSGGVAPIHGHGLGVGGYGQAHGHGQSIGPLGRSAALSGTTSYAVSVPSSSPVPGLGSKPKSTGVNTGSSGTGIGIVASSGAATQISKLPPSGPWSSISNNSAGSKGTSASDGKDNTSERVAGQSSHWSGSSYNSSSFRVTQSYQPLNPQLHSRAFRPARRSAPALSSFPSNPTGSGETPTVDIERDPGYSSSKVMEQDRAASSRNGEIRVGNDETNMNSTQPEPENSLTHDENADRRTTGKRSGMASTSAPTCR